MSGDEKPAGDAKPDRDQKYKDMKLENDLSNGPIDNRGCTDILFCLVFLGFIAGMVAVAILGFTKGNPNLLIYPYDENGRSCGLSLPQTPYIYFYNAVAQLSWGGNTSLMLSQSFCVASCPQNWDNQTLNCTAPLSGNSKSCKVDLINLYLSTPFLGRFCIPSLSLYMNPSTNNCSNPANANVNKSANDRNSTNNENCTNYTLVNSQKSILDYFNNQYISTDKLFSWLGDLVTAKNILLASIGFGFGVAIVYLCLIRIIGSILVYTTILFVQAGLVILGWLFYDRKDYYETVVKDDTYRIAMLVLCIFFWTLAGIWLLYILFMCNSIRLALALLKVTSRFIYETLSVFFVPLIIFVLTIAFYIWWVAVSVYVYSAGEIKGSGSSPLATVTWDSTTRYAWWYNLFGLFWVNAFLNALNQFVIASTACIWYFEQGGLVPEKTLAPVTKSFYRAFRYHLGSLAFGSLIIATIQFLIAVLEYIKQKVGDSAGEKVKLIKCLIDCCQCILDCCARFVEFINRHAYIQIALTGENFCTAASNGFGVIIRNLGRISALALIGGVFMFLGKLFVACATGIIGYILITRIDSINSQLNSPILPTTVMILEGYVIGVIFMGIYGMAQDAFLHCFLCDEDTNGKTAKFAPEELKSFISDERESNS